MTALEVFQALGGPEDAFEVVRSPDGDLDAWIAELRTRATPEFPLRLQKSAGDARVWVVSWTELPAEVVQVMAEDDQAGAVLGRRVQAVEDVRAGALSCTLQSNGPVAGIEIRMPIYEDGLSRHALNVAVLEIAKTRRVLASQLQVIADSARYSAEAEQWMQQEHERLEQEAAAARSASSEAHVAADPPPSPTAPAATASEQASGAARPAAASLGFGGASGLETSATIVSGSRCRRCGGALVESEAFCAACGTPVAAEASAAPAERLCPNPSCRQPVPADKRFCTNCGTRVA